MADPVTEFDQYRAELSSKLGGRAPLEVLQATLDEVSELVEGVPLEQLGRAPAPGEWSAWQVVEHLADADMVFGIRIRMIVTQERPTLVGFDQNAWAARFAALDGDPHTTIARWQAVRRTNLKIYASLSAKELQRVGVHSERGPESAELILTLLAGHDLTHIDQLRRCLGAKA